MKFIDKTLNNNSTFLDYRSLGPNWWIFVIRGALAIIFACIAFVMPVTAVLVMTVIFGIYALIDGIFCVISGVNQVHKHQRWGGLILSGLLSVGAGLIILIAPIAASIGITAFFWALIAFWAVSTGIGKIISAIRLYNEVEGEWLLAADGMLSVILGSIVFWLYWFNPLASIATLGLFVSGSSLGSGLVLLLLAYRLYNREKVFHAGIKGT